MSDTKLVQMNPQSLIKLAINKGAGVEQLEKLMALQERWQANQAKQTFFDAMTTFQAECPMLKKTKKVDYSLKTGGRTKYSYAPLGSIANQIKAVIKKCGLSYRWTIQDDEKTINVTCIVSHKDGHSESTTMSGNLDATGSKNAIQQRGSTVTYLQRYTLIGALGITSADDDTDGNGKVPESKKPELTPDSEQWNQAVTALAQKSVTIAAIKKKYNLTKENVDLLWKNVQNISK